MATPGRSCWNTTASDAIFPTQSAPTTYRCLGTAVKASVKAKEEDTGVAHESKQATRNMVVSWARVGWWWEGLPWIVITDMYKGIERGAAFVLICIWFGWMSGPRDRRERKGWHEKEMATGAQMLSLSSSYCEDEEWEPSVRKHVTLLRPKGSCDRHAQPCAGHSNSSAIICHNRLRWSFLYVCPLYISAGILWYGVMDQKMKGFKLAQVLVLSSCFRN